MGVSLNLRGAKVDCQLIARTSISKVMGDSFKIYAEALVGHEDDLGTRTTPSASTPTMSSQGVVDSMDLETVF